MTDYVLLTLERGDASILDFVQARSDIENEMNLPARVDTPGVCYGVDVLMPSPTYGGAYTWGFSANSYIDVSQIWSRVWIVTAYSEAVGKGMHVTLEIITGDRGNFMHKFESSVSWGSGEAISTEEAGVISDIVEAMLE